jgi:hypothetical protein
MPERPERPDRLEREINEILEKIDHFPTPEQRRARAARRSVHRFGDALSARVHAVMRELSHVSLSQVMLLAFILILGSLFFRRLVPVAWPWMMYAGLVLFLTSFVLMVFGGGGRGGGRAMSGQQHYWRGRPVSYSSDSLSRRMRRWWNRQRR